MYCDSSSAVISRSPSASRAWRPGCPAAGGGAVQRRLEGFAVCEFGATRRDVKFLGRFEVVKSLAFRREEPHGRLGRKVPVEDAVEEDRVLDDVLACLHLGSRIRPGAFRLVLYLQHCTTREITNVFDVDRFRGDPVKHMAVAHSVEPGRAHADKYEMGG